LAEIKSGRILFGPAFRSFKIGQDVRELFRLQLAVIGCYLTLDQPIQPNLIVRELFFQHGMHLDLLIRGQKIG
jgi:hypothetical protein